MAEKRKRGLNFTMEEKDRLVKLLLQQKDTILNKKTDGTTNEAKNKAWTAVTDIFNSSATVHRSKDSLMKAWDKMKSESKVYNSAAKRSCMQTGGGPSDIKFNPILEQVSAILGRGCTGIIGVADSDAIPLHNSSQEPQVLEIQEVHLVESVEEKLEEGPQKQTNSEVNQLTQPPATPDQLHVNATPLWSRRRPQHSQVNERSEIVSTLCDSFRDVNKKKGDIEDLKRQLLQEEIEHKRKLYNMQLQGAEIELQIKRKVLEQIEGGCLNIAKIFGVSTKEDS